MDVHQFSTNPLIFLGYFIFFDHQSYLKKWHGVFGGFLGVFLKELFFTQFWANSPSLVIGSRNSRIPLKCPNKRGLGKQYCPEWMITTVDGWNPENSPVEGKVVEIPIIYHGFIHPRWCRISAINSIEAGISGNRCWIEISCMDLFSCSPMHPSGSERT